MAPKTFSPGGTHRRSDTGGGAHRTQERGTVVLLPTLTSADTNEFAVPWSRSTLTVLVSATFCFAITLLRRDGVVHVHRPEQFARGGGTTWARSDRGMRR